METKSTAEIMKGLECCKTQNGEDCDTCPYNPLYMCTSQLASEALFLIHVLIEQIKQIDKEKSKHV